MIQSIIATLIVVAAAAWLLRRLYLTIRAASGGGSDRLGSCGSCSNNPTNKQQQVIGLGIRRSSTSGLDNAHGTAGERADAR
jgi:hypothetical protein